MENLLPYFTLPKDRIHDPKLPSGLTKLEYFIAHAPTEIPGWFQPHMREAPESVPYLKNVFGKGSDHPMSEIFKKHFNSETEEWEDPENVVPEELKKEVADHIYKIDQYLAQDKRWNVDRNIEYHIQWPIFWATEMMKRLAQ